MTVPETRKLSLPSGPDRILEMGVRFLDRFWDRSQYEFGGGTVLAARWNHRHSSDVDCFMDENTFRLTYERNIGLITEAIRELEASGRLTSRHHSSRMLIMEFADLGEMSLVSGSILTRTRETSEYEAFTGIRLEPKRRYWRRNWRFGFSKDDGSRGISLIW